MDIPESFRPKKDKKLKDLLEGKIKKIPPKKYELFLRADMPPGFKKNKVYPELPAMREFLMQYEGRTFKSPEQFEKVLEKFGSYMKKKKVKLSSDREMRKGLYLAEVNNVEDWYVVYCNSESHAGVCHFGLLQRAEED